MSVENVNPSNSCWIFRSRQTGRHCHLWKKRGDLMIKSSLIVTSVNCIGPSSLFGVSLIIQSSFSKEAKNTKYKTLQCPEEHTAHFNISALISCVSDVHKPSCCVKSVACASSHGALQASAINWFLRFPPSQHGRLYS